MPKVKISEYSATANSNTDVASINIDEGCAPSGINNAIRAVMGHLKDFQQGTNGDPFNGPVNGTLGATTPSTGAFTTLSATGNVTLGDASTDTLNVGNGGLIKDASGNLGLGVTPSAWGSSVKAIQIGARTGVWNLSDNTYLSTNSYFDGTNSRYIGTQFATMYSQQNDGAHKFYVAPSGTAGNAITFTQAMTLEASGELGVGTTSPTAIIHSYSANLGDGGGIKIQNGGAGGATFAIWPTATANGEGAGKLIISGPSGNAVTLDSSGNLLVGATSGSKHVLKKDNNNNEAVQFENSNTSSPYGGLFFLSGASPNNSTNYFLTCVDGGFTTRATIRSNGGLANYSGNNVNLSDRREKTNFALAKSYLDVICAIPVQTFNYIDQNMEDDGGLTLGVVAQDVQAVAPELVMESNWANKDEEPKMRLSIYQTDLQYALMKCIQEQQALITTLTARITALESA